MKVYINIKSISRTRGIEPIEYLLKQDIQTVEDLICNLVDIEIDKYENHHIKVLSQEDINSMLTNGKISFGFKYREILEKEHGLHTKVIDRNEAKDIATLAFADGLFSLFINEDQFEKLDDMINIKDNDEITLIRLSMLAGRYF